MDISESTVFRDRVGDLYVQCRCDKKEAFDEIQNMLDSSGDLCLEDALVVKGYFGDLLLHCDSLLIPRDESRGKCLLSEMSVLEEYDDLSCSHLLHLLAIYYIECCTGMEREMFQLMHKAADQGHVRSMAKLGYYYDSAIAVTNDVNKAFTYHHVAATNGNPIAQYNLGLSFKQGTGCTKNLSLAFEWFQKSADQGYQEAVFEIGCCFRFSVGVEHDFVKAAHYFAIAAEREHTDAMFRLAWCYLSGRGIVKDERKAVHWHTLAAKKGHIDAYELLGEMNKRGWGMEKNVVEAVRNYKKAIYLAKQQGCTEEVVNRLIGQVSNLADEYKQAVS